MPPEPAANVPVSDAPATKQDQRVDAAIQKALVFLRQEQRPTGGWMVDEFDGEATSVSSLAMMAMMASGHVPGDATCGKAFERGVDYLLDHQQPNGMLLDHRGHGPMYCHGMSTLFLAEVVGMVPREQEQRVREALERAIALIIKAQIVEKGDRHRGGWRYLPGSSDSDLSVTGWQLLALRAAKDIGCDVPAENIDLAIAYVKACRSGDHRGFAYQPGGEATPTLTGTGLLALQVCGEHDTDDTRVAVDFLRIRPPRPRTDWYFYGIYYGTVGLHANGGVEWAKQKTALFDTLLAEQSDNGSWAGHTNEEGFGRVYSTSLAVLALTVEYGYLPIYQR